MSCRASLLFACLLSLSCGGKIIGSESGGGDGGGQDGTLGPESSVEPESSTGPEPSVGPETGTGPETSTGPDDGSAGPDSESTFTLDSGMTCTADTTSQSMGSDGSCKISFSGTCTGGIKSFQVMCYCPMRECTCDTAFSSGGYGGGGNSFDGCPSCSMEEAWKSCALSLSR